MKLLPQTKNFLFAYGVLAILTAIFIVPFCGLIYQCGCTFIWSGAMQACNYYHEHGPHCPWCVAGENPLIASAPVLVLLAGEGLVTFVLARRNASFAMLLISGAIAFWILGIATGWIFKLLYDYPYFFFFG